MQEPKTQSDNQVNCKERESIIYMVYQNQLTFSGDLTVLALGGGKGYFGAPVRCERSEPQTSEASEHSLQSLQSSLQSIYILRKINQLGVLGGAVRRSLL